MFTRVVHCTLKPETRGEFDKTLHEKILPEIKKQPGFMTLIGLVSSERPNYAMAVTFWRTQEDADRYYRLNAPMVDHLKPLVTKAEVEHFFVDSGFDVAGKSQAA